jgi:HSP20 family protein
MIQSKKQKEDTSKGNLFPAVRNDFFANRFFTPPLLDFNHDFFEENFYTPPVNIIETNENFRLDLFTPGMKRENFKVEVENGILTLQGEKEKNEKEGNENYCRCEFSYNSFSRTFQLPDNVDETHIHAKYNNGILEVTIPKKEITASRPKTQITVI